MKPEIIRMLEQEKAQSDEIERLVSGLDWLKYQEPQKVNLDFLKTLEVTLSPPPAVTPGKIPRKFGESLPCSVFKVRV